MFKSLAQGLNKVFDKIKSRGVLTEADIDSAMRDVRLALLEADVALPVVKEFINKTKEKAFGEEVIKSVRPGHMVVKIVQDELTLLLSSESQELTLTGHKPKTIMMVGLQGSGKTTTSAKLAKKLLAGDQTVTLASLDTYRPGAQTQLEVLAKQIGANSLEIVAKEDPLTITKRALKCNSDILILDTAGRLHIDNEMMQELRDIKKLAKPSEVLLVLDAMTGQDALNIAKNFAEEVGVTGLIFTRVDGDMRGGAILSAKFVTQVPVKFIGVGEKLENLEEFYPDRIASRILDMGDIVSLVEKAKDAIDEAEAEDFAKKVMKQKGLDFDDLLKQFRTIRKMGGFASMIGMIPGLSSMGSKAPSAEENEKMIARQEAIITSMTRLERRDYRILNGSRKRRIAKGSGVDVAEVNKLIKQLEQMNKMVKMLSNGNPKSMMRGGLQNLLRM